MLELSPLVKACACLTPRSGRMLSLGLAPRKSHVFSVVPFLSLARTAGGFALLSGDILYHFRFLQATTRRRSSNSMVVDVPEASRRPFGLNNPAQLCLRPEQSSNPIVLLHQTFSQSATSRIHYFTWQRLRLDSNQYQLGNNQLSYQVGPHRHTRLIKRMTKQN